MSGFADTAPPTTKHLLLLGAGQAHLQLLKQRWRKRRPQVRITLVSPTSHPVSRAMLPGYVAGQHALQDCRLDLAQLARASGVSWLTRSARHIDAAARRVMLDDGSELQFDWLSVDIGAAMDREQIERSLPGACEYGLFVRPIETFCKLWPRVNELAGRRDLRLAVIGADPGAVELALALRHGLPGSAVSLIAGPQPLGHGQPAAMRIRIAAALRLRQIAVLPDNASAIRETEVELATGVRLACDVPVITTGARAPAWLADSGLALDAQGRIEVDACQRSTSHSQVLAAGDVASRSDDLTPHGGIYTRRPGMALAANLEALIAGRAGKPFTAHRPELSLLGCGDREAIAGWDGWSAQGRWVWYWKTWLDRSWVGT